MIGSPAMVDVRRQAVNKLYDFRLISGPESSETKQAVRGDEDDSASSTKSGTSSPTHDPAREQQDYCRLLDDGAGEWYLWRAYVFLQLRRNWDSNGCSTLHKLRSPAAEPLASRRGCELNSSAGYVMCAATTSCWSISTGVPWEPLCNILDRNPA